MFRRDFFTGVFGVSLTSLLGIKPKEEIHIIDARRKNEGLVLFMDVGGTLKYYKDGKLHRNGDLPAEIYPNGSQYFYKDGKLHRDGDQPAVIYADGTQYYYKDGKRHRDGDKPAVINANGTLEYYHHGEVVHFYKNGAFHLL